jgi:hypothetical protein
MNRSIFGFLAVFLVVSGCAQGDQEPAELATEYKNHVSFMLDSAEWVANSDGSISVIDEVITAEIGDEEGKRTFLLTAWNVTKGSSSSISLYTDSVIVGQPIPLNGSSGRASFTSKNASAAKPSFLTSDAQHNGTLTVTVIDTVARRVSGIFDCKLGTLSITSGKFDSRYSAPKPM